MPWVSTLPKASASTGRVEDSINLSLRWHYPVQVLAVGAERPLSLYWLPLLQILDGDQRVLIYVGPWSRNSVTSDWKWWTPFSRLAANRPRSYERDRRPRCTCSQTAMSSCWISSENAIVCCMDSHPAPVPGSAKNHSKMVSVRSGAIGRMTLVLMLSWEMFSIGLGK